MSKIENAGEFIPAGDTVFRVQENYKATRVLEIAEDGNDEVKSYRSPSLFALQVYLQSFL